MKCLYYLAPTLDSTHQISDDLHDVGVQDWLLHVISRDKAGLKKEQIQSSNYIETRDIVRGGLIGANIGFIVGVLCVGLLMWLKPFGDGVPLIALISVVVFWTLFGSWEGGLYGVSKQNKKIEPFADALDSGQYLILIYAKKELEDTVKSMMSERHPEAQHVATDRHFINPFGVVRRRRRPREASLQDSNS